MVSSQRTLRTKLQRPPTTPPPLLLLLVLVLVVVLLSRMPAAIVVRTRPDARRARARVLHTAHLRHEGPLHVDHEVPGEGSMGEEGGFFGVHARPVQVVPLAQAQELHERFHRSNSWPLRRRRRR